MIFKLATDETRTGRENLETPWQTTLASVVRFVAFPGKSCFNISDNHNRQYAPVDVMVDIDLIL